MLRFECDNPELSQTLAKLCTLVEQNGGQFHSALVLKALDGNLGFQSTLSSDQQELLMSIPKDAFVPIDGIKFKLEDEKIVIASGAEKINPTTKNLLDLMLDVYNQTDKIRKYKNSSPRVVFCEDEEMLTQLASGRPNTNLAKILFDYRNAETQEDKDQVAIKYFFKTRNFNFAGAENQVIPFIDFVNHHSMAPSFQRNWSERENVRMELINAKPGEGDECFARYGKWDALDTYLMFGFSTEFQSFVRSVPLTITLENLGKIEVKANIGGQYKGQVSKELEPLIGVIPQFTKTDPKTLVASNLAIPHIRWPMAFKRILRLLFMQLNPSLTVEEQQQHMASAEYQVLTTNLEFYDNLLKFFETKRDQYKDVPAFREAVKMVKVQQFDLNKHKNYNVQMAEHFGGEGA